MENKKTGNLKKIIIGVVITFLIGGTSPWWWNKYVDPPIVPKEIVKKQEIYKKGNKTLEIEGVYIRPPKKNMSDSFIFKNIDLELGTFTNSIDSDIKISININKLLISVNLKEGALIGKTETTYLNCKNLLQNNNGKKIFINNKRTPTSFYCTETDSGRISQFQFASIKRYKTPKKNMYSIIIDLKYTTWKL